MDIIIDNSPFKVTVFGDFGGNIVSQKGYSNFQTAKEACCKYDKANLYRLTEEANGRTRYRLLGWSYDGIYSDFKRNNSM